MMNKEQFLAEISEILQLDEVLTEQIILADLEEWDSMAYLGVISLFDMEFSKSIANSELKELETVADLVKLAGL